jgi:arsenate reductase
MRMGDDQCRPPGKGYGQRGVQLRWGCGILLWCRGKEVLMLRREMTTKIRVLFVCTANAARSQMAEGLLRAKYGERYEVFSAGTRKAKVSERAIMVMREIGIDISHHRSKILAELYGESYDLAVTLCDNAHAICPVVSGAKKTIHHGFADPHLTPGTDEVILNEYRRVRDEISNWIDKEF